MTLSRRTVLGAGIGAALTGCTSGDDSGRSPTSTTAQSVDSTTTTPESTTTTTTGPVAAPQYEGAPPFSLGIASGDPDSTSVVLWTRLRVAPIEDGPFSPTDTQIAVDVSADETFDDVVMSELVDAPAAFDHSVHALVTDLDPDTWYFFRFRLGEHASTTGRTRTSPDGGTSPVRFGFSSCQNWESGAYGAHRHLAESDLDLFIWLGDYIYEYGPGNRGVVGSAGLREHDTPEVSDLHGYRRRYALYKSDADLQAHHAARPWIVTWDDHEVDNDYAGLASEDDQDRQAFLARRRDAQQAWWENMPVRLDPPTGDTYAIHRTLQWGDLLDLHMLDGRQYRDPQPTDGEPVVLPGVGDLGVRRIAATARDPSHTMLGGEQRSWLEDEVRASTAIWTVLGNQVYMHGLDAFPGDAPATNVDTWDGYHGEREALLGVLAAHQSNIVVLSGDFHSSTAADLRANPFERETPVIGAEFMAPAISSTFPESLRSLAPLALGLNPQIKHFDPDNGYMTCEVSHSTWTTQLHRLVDVTDAASSIATVATFIVQSGTPGISSIAVSE